MTTPELSYAEPRPVSLDDEAPAPDFSTEDVPTEIQERSAVLGNKQAAPTNPVIRPVPAAGKAAQPEHWVVERPATPVEVESSLPVVAMIAVAVVVILILVLIFALIG